MKLFAVFHGEYDQFELYGVFSSAERAAAFLADLNSRVIQGATKGCHGEPYKVTEDGTGSVREIALDGSNMPRWAVLPAEWKVPNPCACGLPGCHLQPVSV
jgi:hypothetical protein